MRRMIIFLVVLFLAFVTLPAQAFEGGLAKGDLEVNGRLGFAHNMINYDGESVGSTTNIDFAAFVGGFISDAVELGGSFMASFQSIDPDNGESYSATMIGIGPDIIFNFNNYGPVVPFIDVGVAFAFYGGDLYGDENGFILPSIQAGIRALIGNAASANFGVGYAHATNYEGIKDASNNSLGLFVGFSVFP